MSDKTYTLKQIDGLLDIWSEHPHMKAASDVVRQLLRVNAWLLATNEALAAKANERDAATARAGEAERLLGWLCSQVEGCKPKCEAGPFTMNQAYIEARAFLHPEPKPTEAANAAPDA